MRAERIALIHSPLVGPSTWAYVADALRGRRRRRVETPAASAWDVNPATEPALARRIAAELGADRDGPWLLVVHSAAGALAPAIADAGLDVAAVMFVDAVLPHPGQSWLDTAPPALGAQVLAAARDGHAPAWPDWFPPAVIERLLPQRESRKAFAAECRPVPLGYLSAPSPRPHAWPPPCAYLQLSDAYAAEAAAAARHWPVESLPLHHLAMLTEPAKVAAAIERLVDRIP